METSGVLLLLSSVPDDVGQVVSGFDGAFRSSVSGLEEPSRPEISFIES